MNNNEQNQLVIDDLINAINSALNDLRYGDAAKYLDILAFLTQ